MQIVKATMDDIDHIVEMYVLARRDLQQNDIHQWDHDDPSIQMLATDIHAGTLFVAKDGERLLGSIVLDEQPEPEHCEIDWCQDDAKSLYLHRLVVHPDYQGEGTGKILMQFAEKYAEDHHYDSIRLDAYEDNDVARGLYERFGYEERGKVYFPRREVPFYSYEKELQNST